jgi:alkaline phosphatase D
MKTLFLSFLLLSGISISFGQDTITRIAFGSCGHQDKPLTIFQTVVEHQPDLFIFLGDNIYGDTDKMCQLKKKYRKLAKNKNFKKLRETTPIIATWDDHDYGFDDIGKYYTKKERSKKVFLKFFKEPKDSERRDHEGIYTSYEYHVEGKTLQIILLDCRTFRNDLLPYDGSLKGNPSYKYSLDYSPYKNNDSTMLGEQQWKWLEGELKKPADIRIIGSSTQFATEYNGYETWANFPYQQQQMFDVINRMNAKGVFFISGDVHYSELSKMEATGSYPIYDLTCSGLTEEWKFATPNRYRIGEPVMDNHFGIINIDWKNTVPLLSLEVWDKNNVQRIQQTVPLTELYQKVIED